MNWKIYLNGDGPDLQMLAEAYDDPADDYSVLTDDNGKHYVTVTKLASLTDVDEVSKAAAEVVASLNGTGRVLHGSAYRPVTLTGTYTSPSGQTHHLLEVHDAVMRSHSDTVTLTVIDSDGNVVPPPPKPRPGPKLMALAESNPAVRDVFEQLVKTTPNWTDLWKVSQIIYRSLPGETSAVDMGWLTKDEWDSFKASAHSWERSGDAGRHPRKEPLTPDELAKIPTMSIGKGQELIYGVTRAWINWLGGAQS